MILEASNLVKTYKRHGQYIYALDNVSLNVNEGDFITITGSSGSGKTTLLLVLGGLIRPTSGQMLFRDSPVNLQSVSEMETFRSTNVAYVMQNFALIPYLTAAENIQIAMNGNIRSQQKRERTDELLRMVGLLDRCDHLPSELSAGQQQRVAIARALANRPSILLADEPTGNLDPALSAEIMETLCHINRNGTTILMVTHSQKAAEYGTCQLRLENGKIIN